ncbi:HD domain-containing protein [Candidatus Uhrbacteria bacterium]|nr:HD domain-containing protein [Candidatus Uhrbacteria bacterium]
MDIFSQYLDPRVTLEERLRHAFDRLLIPDNERAILTAFLEPLRSKSPVTRAHYEHSIRVALLARHIAQFMHLNEKPAFTAGLMHDIGKCQVDLGTLGKTEGWTEADTEAIKAHVIDGYRFLRNCLDFTAEIVVLHHRFQKGDYPDELPPHLHNYSEETKAMIALYGRILALADTYDALHRVNDKFGACTTLSGEEIKEKMIELNIDQHRLISQLYDIGIFTTALIAEKSISQ